MVVFSLEFRFFHKREHTQKKKTTNNLVPGKLRPPLGQPVRIVHCRVATHNVLAFFLGGEGKGGESYMTPDTSKEPAVYDFAELRSFIIYS